MRFAFPKKFSFAASASALTLMIYLGAGVFAPSAGYKFFSMSAAWAAESQPSETSGAPNQAQQKSAKTSESFQKLQDEILEPETSDSTEKPEIQNDEQNNSQSGDLPLTEAAQKTPKNAEPPQNEPPQNETSSAPAFQPTTILPSKIKPVHDAGTEDGLSRAAAPIQSAPPGNDSLSADSAPSLGLLALPLTEDAHIGSDWAKLKSKDFIEKFSQIDANKLSEDDAKAAVTALASYVPSDLKDEKKPSENSAALYTIRLKKLLEFGEFEKIIQLYKMNDGAPPAADALYAGVVSMLASGDQALACLEYKAGPADFKHSPAAFWAHMGVFCDALISPAATDPGADPESKMAAKTAAKTDKVKDSKAKDSKTKNTSKDGAKTGLSAAQNPDGLMDSVKLAQLESRKKWMNAARLYLSATHQNTADSLPNNLKDLNISDPLTVLAWGSTGALTQLIESQIVKNTSSTLSLSLFTRALLLHSGLENPKIVKAIRESSQHPNNEISDQATSVNIESNTKNDAVDHLNNSDSLQVNKKIRM